MSIRLSFAFTAAASLLASGIWMFTSPFPAPRLLIDLPSAALVTRLGPPSSQPSNLGAFRSTRSLTWTRVRGLAFWTLEVNWRKQDGAELSPEFVSLEVRLPLIGLTIPRGTIARGVIAPS